MTSPTTSANVAMTADLRSEVVSRFAERTKLDRQSLDRAAQVAARSGEKIDVVLNKLGLVSDEIFVEVWSEVTGVPPFSGPVSEQSIDTSGLSLQFIERSGSIPLQREGDGLTLGVTDPLDEFSPRAIGAKLKSDVQRVVISPAALVSLLRRLPAATFDDAGDLANTDAIANDVERLSDITSDAPIIRLVNQIIETGLALKASDIHIGATRHGARLRYRVDGLLRDHPAPPASAIPAILSRLKIMAGLDISERRVPQDGRIRTTWQGREIDLRLATMPHVDAEGAILRVLDRTTTLLELDALDFTAAVGAGIKRFLRQPQGMLLVTGPTGSGKTTTLYAALNHLSGPGRNIISIEDPVEVFLRGVNQVQVNRAVGLDFSKALRAALRQDPDIVMVGEIRDRETATIAIQAALTGHLVLATLHTNDAVSAITRLVDMGVEPFLVAATINAVLAQRLLRRTCPACQGQFAGQGLKRSASVAGRFECDSCEDTGFSGRTTIAELLEVRPEIRSLIGRNAAEREILAVAVEAGFVSLAQDGYEKADRGITTRDEVLRVIGHSL